MKPTLIALTLALSSPFLLAQEKPVPKDSVRLFINGCAKGRVFIVGERREDQPGRSDVRPGTRLRMNGPKKVMDEIKAREGTEIEITGLIRKGQELPGGVALGGGVSIGAGPPVGGNASRSPNMNIQVMIDVEGYRTLVGSCPND
jgi:hypothetical protein